MPVGKENENENEYDYDEILKAIAAGFGVATSVSEWRIGDPLSAESVW